jgi:CheY-like chemotaxis protein
VATILICDDEEPLRALVRAALDGRGHVVHEAADGDEALALWRRLRPDLVVLDVNMPRQTGLDVLKTVRTDEDGGGAKVVVVTARVTDRAAAATAGADLFLSKPFSAVELGQVVDALLDDD